MKLFFVFFCPLAISGTNLLVYLLKRDDKNLDKTSLKIEKTWFLLVHCAVKIVKWFKKTWFISEQKNREQKKVCLFEFNCIIINDLLQQFPHREHTSEALLNKSSGLQVFFKIGVLKHFLTFTPQENTRAGK